MKQIIIIIFINLTLVFLLKVEAQYKLSDYVIGNGATIVSNSNHTLTATIGQPIIGNTSNDLNTGNIGFWYQYARTITDVEDRWMFEVPQQFELYQNYPNPFNPSTTIKYTIPSVIANGVKQSHEITHVVLKVYDILGREVSTLVNKQQKAGYYEVDWNASNNSSGVYFYRIQSGDFVEIKKMVLLR